MAKTDMRIPIQYALFYPERKKIPFNLSCDLLSIAKLEFEAPDLKKFPCLEIAYETARAGKTYPIVLNAANEIAVQLFLKGVISFGDIYKIIQSEINAHKPFTINTIDEIIELDNATRKRVSDNIKCTAI